LDEVSQAVPDEEVRPAPSEEPSIGTLLEDAITDEPQLKAKPKSKAKKAAAPAKPSVFKPATPVSDAIAEGLAEDDEDVYLLALAIKKSRTGDLPAIGEPADEEPEPELKHSTGSARTQGYYKIREVDKSAYLPSRNRAAVEVEASTANAIATATSRSTRVNTRRLVQGMEQHKKATATDTDVFQFNQLRTRKKHLKFSKSPIHDWGLYAMEFIPQGEMVIEYVGEVIRAQVADIREKYYEKTGIGSSYLFRVDDDAVVDATKKGNLG
jgi:histone-lysine N-methyltransferase SETD1